MRHTLVDGQGNFGSVDGDPPAAYRYTEARLEALAEAMMADLDKDTVDYVPNFDETTTEPTVLPTPFPNLLVNGSTGHRGGHGDQRSAAQPPRGHRRRRLADREHPHDRGLGRRRPAAVDQGTEAPRPDRADSRSGFPDRRADCRPARRARGLPHRPRRDSDPRQGRNRADEEGRSQPDRHHRDSLSGQQGQAPGAHRRPGARQGRRRHLRHPRRIRSRRHARRHRAEARRDRRGRPQQSLQAHPAPADLRDHHAGHRRRPTASAQSARSARELRRVQARRRSPPDRVRAAQGRGARPHSRGAAHRAGQPRCGHHADSIVEEPGRGEVGFDRSVRPQRHPGAGDPRHAAPAPHRPRAAEDSRRARPSWSP